MGVASFPYALLALRDVKAPGLAVCERESPAIAIDAGPDVSDDERLAPPPTEEPA
jgi:hypothetical protein